jgi:hypothetical protein
MNSSNSLSARRTRPTILLLIVLLGGFALSSDWWSLSAAPDATQRVFTPVVFVPTPAAGELLVFDWNGPITTDHHGAPSPDPLPEWNGDWTQPVIFAQGTIHLRIEVRRMPQPQSMRLQICWWQDGRETCTRAGKIVGQPGAATTWSQEVARLWSLDERPVDWSRPRANGIFVRDGRNAIVSDHGDWNWAGHDPADWFPLDVRFTAVVVEAGGTFSGWDSYLP